MSKHFPFQLFTIAFLCAMFFPRTIPEGMFFDGLFYANIARDMVYGTGTFWQPHFFVTFWGEHIGNTTDFYGHPSLAMWLLSWWYRVFGDHWFVEKAFCVFIWLISVLLVKKIWVLSYQLSAIGYQLSANKNLYESNTESLKPNTRYPLPNNQSLITKNQTWWLPLFIWYLMPVVMWSYPYFILDNVMGVFSLGASLFLIEILHDGKNRLTLVRYFLSVLMLHLAFLTKGPVGLYPLAIPFLYACIYSENLPVKKGFYISTILFLLTGASLFLWYFYEPARLFWQNYFHTQIMSSVAQNEHTEVYSWKDYTLVLQNLGVSALPGIIFAFLIWSFSKIKRTSLKISLENKKRALFYFLIAISGSLPMLVSHKTSWHYLIPCLPFLAMSFAALFESTVEDWSDKFALPKEKSKNINRLMWLLNFGVAVYCFSLIGTVTREKELINDLKVFKKIIPTHTLVGVPKDIMNDFTYHAYFERYGDWILQSQNDSLKFCLKLKNENKPDSVFNTKFKNQPLPSLKLFDVYVKEN